MAIRAKMSCISVKSTAYLMPGDGFKKHYNETVELSAVAYGDSDENKSFSEATPFARVEMTISNQKALGAFEPGEDYYVDFTPAGDKPQPES